MVNSSRIKKVLLLVLTFVIVLTIAYRVIPYEMRLRQYVDYDTVIMQHGIFSVVHNEKENCIYFVGITNANNIFIPKEKKIFLFTKFNLDTRTVENEYYKIRNDGKWSNEFAENARELYAYMTYLQIKHGIPKYNMYMGITEKQPNYESLGTGITELQYVEIDGLFVFMFLEEFANATESLPRDETSEQFFNGTININLTEDTYMALFAWPVSSSQGNPIDLDRESMNMVADTVKAITVREIHEQDSEFNADLYNLVNAGDSLAMDRLDNYIFVHSYDYRNDLVDLLNNAEHEQLDRLIAPECIIVHDYNIERQTDYAYVIFDGKYYLVDEESVHYIITMFNALCEQVDTSPSIATVGIKEQADCYLHFQSARTWTGDGWLYSDGIPLACVLEEPHVSKIPTVSYSPELEYKAAYGIRKPIEVYDENMIPVQNGNAEEYILSDLAPGTYYCVFTVDGPPGKVIPGEGEEYIIYKAIFRLVVD